MQILMIAPEPFFEPRGTPFSEYHRIRALTDLGHTVDLVTYPFGKEISLPGLRVFRCARPPWVRQVRVGPSMAKVPLDLALGFTALRRALAGRYDAVHSHEEGGTIGVPLALLLGVPHVYDMHSSLPQQLTNFSFSRSRLLHWLFERLERFLIRRSRVVVVICPHLGDIVRRIKPSANAILIENAPGSAETAAAETNASVRNRLGLAPATPTVLYTGTFEAYQGLDLLLAAAQRVAALEPSVRFVLTGGRPAQVAEVRARTRALGIPDAVIFTGERPAEEIPSLLAAADVLVSPRCTGTNTPLKIYQYLRAGRPIVATRLLTHTQVLDDEIAILTDPTPDGFAEGILRALTDREMANRIGRRAREFAEAKYSYASYLSRTRTFCEALGVPVAAEATGRVA